MTSLRKSLDRWPYLVLVFVVSLAVIGIVQSTSGNGAARHDTARASPLTPAEEKSFRGWYTDAAGYEAAYKLHEQTGKPMLVYFYAPWCPYCKRFNATVLSSPVMKRALLKDYLPVRIYPENGMAEENLMRIFKAEGYPTVFVKTKAMKRFEMIDTGDAAARRLRTPEEFLGAMKAAGDN